MLGCLGSSAASPQRQELGARHAYHVARPQPPNPNSKLAQRTNPRAIFFSAARAKSKVGYQAVIAEWAAEQKCKPAAAVTESLPEVDTTISELLAAYLRHAQECYVKGGQITQPQTAVPLDGRERSGPGDGLARTSGRARACQGEINAVRASRLTRRIRGDRRDTWRSTPGTRIPPCRR